MMKIAFLCGSLEPGRDGVGDYTRLLAEELVRHGHQAIIVGMYDYYENLYSQSISTSEGLCIYRIPINWSIKNRIKEIKELIELFNPDFLSLQFVPFSFDPKGLPYSLGGWLKNLAGNRKWHIMFHELWVGEKNGSLKDLLYSRFQRLIIKKMIASLNPFLIHTNLPCHISMLGELGFRARKLSLFSNIPSQNNGSHHFQNLSFRIGVFSQAEDSAEVIQFLVRIAELIKSRGLDMDLLLIGEESKMKKFEESLTGYEIFKDRVRCVGFLDALQISKALQECTIGLTSVPRHALGKSGSVAAFLSNGVPIAAPVVHHGFNPHDIGFFDQDICSTIITEFDFSALENSRRLLELIKGKVSLQAVAGSFLNDIQELQYSFKQGSYSFIRKKHMVSVVIPVYGQWELVKRNIDALLEYDREYITEIIVIDDCSPEVNPYTFEKSIVKVVSNERNLGYAGTVNHGLKEASSEIVILLDSDACPLEPFVLKLVSMYQTDSLVGCIGFKTVDEEGNETGSHELEPSTFGLVVGQLLLKKLDFLRLFRSKNILPYSCSVSFRRQCLQELNYLDGETFPVLDADNDLGMRIHRSRWKLLYSDEIRICHKGGHSYKINSTRVLLFHESRWKLLRKHNKIIFPYFTKALIKLRIRLEIVVLEMLAHFNSFNGDFKEKAQGRKIILKKVETFS